MELHRAKSRVAGSDEWAAYESKRMLGLGCGPGLHSEYAADNGASKVVGVDLSSYVIEKVKSNSKFPTVVQYEVNSVSDIGYPADSFDSVISSMAFHYVLSPFEDIVKRVKTCLVDDGSFVFSIANPVLTNSSSAN